MSVTPLRRGWLGRRDDRARLLAFLLLTFSWASITSVGGATLALCVALAGALSCGLRPLHLARRLAPILTLLLLLLALTPFWHPAGASPLVASWAWGPSDLGLRAAGLLALRVLALSTLALWVFEVAPFEQSLRGLRGLGAPLALVHTTLLTQRALTRFREDLTRVDTALHVRGLTSRGPRALPTYASVAGGLLVRGVERTERLEQAMRCRGYAGELILPPPPRPGLPDALLLAAALPLALAWPLLERRPWELL